MWVCKWGVADGQVMAVLLDNFLAFSKVEKENSATEEVESSRTQEVGALAPERDSPLTPLLDTYVHCLNKVSVLVRSLLK